MPWEIGVCVYGKSYLELFKSTGSRFIPDTEIQFKYWLDLGQIAIFSFYIYTIGIIIKFTL